MSTFGGIKIGEYAEITPNSLDEVLLLVDDYNRMYHTKEVSDIGFNTGIKAYYRGQENSSWNIEPSIVRYKENERAFFRKHADYLQGQTLFQKIAYLQHYYTGTRFIDFTTDPDIALFFSCNNGFDYDGSLFLYIYDSHKSSWVDTDIVMTEIITMEDEGEIQVEDFAELLLRKYEKIRNKFNNCTDLCQFLMAWLNHGYMLLPEEEDLDTNNRMYRQKGVFFACGVDFVQLVDASATISYKARNYSFISHSVHISDSLRNKAPLIKCIIKKEIKPVIIEYLDKKGINGSYLFGKERTWRR